MKKAKYKCLLDKSISSCIAAIEIYNKPAFEFREEAFSVLMCIAWELLLKAKILRDNRNDFNSIIEKDYKINKNGNKSKHKHPKINRAGNSMTIGLLYAMESIRSKGVAIDAKCYENLLLLTEIRDNSIHFINKTYSFGRTVQEIGTASVKNYMALASEWFRYDFSRFNFYLMPLSFFSAAEVVESFSPSRKGNISLQNLEKYVRSVISKLPSSDDDKYNVALSLSVKFIKSSDSSAIRVRTSNDPSAIPITLTESDFLQKYPLDFASLIFKLREQKSNFKQNSHFNQIKRELETEPKYCMTRLLDPKNTKSPRKKYYSDSIVPILISKL
jgi:hypothetical protein